MAKKFTIKQLMYAREVCFPADFIRLWVKYAPPDLNTESMARVQMGIDFDLMKWLFRAISRGTLKTMGPTIDAIIAELIGDYE